MSNSSLVTYTLISPNKNHPRNHVIDTITIHHMAGNLSVERCGQLFQDPKKKGSSNYGIGSDGRIALYVDEGDRAWTSGNAANDNRAITIEVANNMVGEPWSISDAAYNSLINLLIDICQRNEIKQLRWHNNKKLIGHVDVQNMTVHRWFQSTACPGTYLMNKMPEIAKAVNAVIVKPDQPYLLDELRADVRKWAGVKTNKEAFDRTIKISTMWNKHHELVTYLERYLKYVGLYEGEIEADKGQIPDYGKGMKQAMIKFQEGVVGLKKGDGVLDPKGDTWRRLLLL